MTKLATKLDEYDSLPSLNSKSLFFEKGADDEEHTDELEAVAEEETERLEHTVALKFDEKTLGDASLLNLLGEEDEDAAAVVNQSSLSALAERTRSQLLERRSQIFSSAARGDDDSVVHEEEAQAPQPPQPAAAASNAANRATARPRTAPQASMMTHAPSRMTHATNGQRCVGGGHTFGGLPRASPSGTMAHHASGAAGAATGVVPPVLRRPSSARGRARREAGCAADAEGNNELGVVEERAGALARFYNQEEPPKRPQSAPERPVSAEASGAASKPFGADAKGGALAWGRPATKPRVPLAHRPGTQQASARGSKAGGSGDAGGGVGGRRQPGTAASSSSHAAFAFVHDIQECCGDEFEEFCCRRHHPDDMVVCCEKHAPAASRSASTANGGAADRCRPATTSLQGSSVVVAKRASGAGGSAMRKRYEKLVLSSDSHMVY